MNNAANTPALLIEGTTPGEQMLHLQYTPTCVTPSYPYPLQTHFSQMLGTMIQIPPRKTSQQHHWIMMCGLKIQFQIDTCVSMRHLMSQITSVPILAHKKAPPSGCSYHNQHHGMKQYFTMIQWTSVTSHQIFQTS